MNNKTLKYFLEKNKVLLIQFAIISMIILLIPIIANPILDITINILLGDYAIKFDSNIYSSLVTAIIACITAFFGYKYAIDQFYSSNKVYLTINSPKLYYYNYDNDSNRFCSHKEIVCDDKSSHELEDIIFDTISNRYYEVFVDNLGNGICSNFNIDLDFKKWSYINQIIEDISDNPSDKRSNPKDVFTYQLTYIEPKNKTSAYFDWIINTVIASLCIIDEKCYKNSTKYKGTNYFIKKWFKIADIQISYFDLILKQNYTIEYDLKIKLESRLKVLRGGIEPKYRIYSNMEYIKSTIKK